MKKFLFALLAALALTVAPVEAESNLSIDTATAFTGPTVCRAGFSPPQCNARPYDTAANLAYPGNGAQPAVALNTIPGYSAIHQAQFVNDGFYGNGSSWIDTTANSWIKVDLGCAASVDSVRFGRDRTGAFDDRDPGQVTILGAVNDVYANGDAADDSAEYEVLFDSADEYNGAINGSQTLKASFGPTVARYLKIQFQNGGAAIDEIEVMGGGCDTTPPSVAITTPVDGFEYVQGDEVVADFECIDDVTAAPSCVGDEEDGAVIDTATLGSYDFTVVGADDAGNGASVTHSYTVVANTPPNKDACKKGGWRDYTDDEGTAFRNQGDCVSYVATGGQNPANG